MEKEVPVRAGASAGERPVRGNVCGTARPVSRQCRTENRGARQSQFVGAPGSATMPPGREDRSRRDGGSLEGAGRRNVRAVFTILRAAIRAATRKSGFEIGSGPARNDIRPREGGHEPQGVESFSGKRTFGVFVTALGESLRGMATTTRRELEHGFPDPVDAPGFACHLDPGPALQGGCEASARRRCE